MRTYEKAWHAAALVAAGVFVTVALLQSSHGPLLLLVSTVSILGAAVQVTSPLQSPRARRQFRDGFIRVALLTLVVIGIGHHLTAGLLTVALLGISSPWVARAFSRT